MGIAKQDLLDEAESETAQNAGMCEVCGMKLSAEELETERGQCFNCYSDEQD